jgi:hypothetical protein
MTRSKGRRAQLGGLLAVALGALAIFVLPGLAGAKGSHRSDDQTGTIASFDAGSKLLTIDLKGGQSFTAAVDRGTRIRCEDQSGNGRRVGAAARSGEPEPGDGHGGRGNEPGDDNGGRGNEPGDDNGGNSGSGSSGSGGHDDNGSGANCTSADLAVGAAVHEAELELEHGRATWDEIELVG